MTRSSGRRWAVGVVLALAAGFTVAAEKQAKPKPENFSGTLMVVNAPAKGIVHMRITIERWSSDDERKGYAEVLKNGDCQALAQAMEKTTVGYLRFDQNLRYPLAYAIKARTDKGEMIRVATNRPINVNEQMQAFRSKDYPIGFVEFTLPPEGAGEGVLILAANVDFNDKGQLEVKTLPQSTGPQRVTNMARD